MRRTWLSSGAALASFAVSSAAFAADPQIRVFSPTAPAIYNWTGIYSGLNIGGAWASGTVTDNLTGASFTGGHSGVIGGGTAGFNWQVTRNFVVGMEGTFQGTSIGNTSDTVSITIGGIPSSIQAGAATNWVATLAARLGIAADNWLFYGKAGSGWADNSVTLNSQTTFGSFSASNATAGWLVGGGVEYALAPTNWTIKAEFDHLELSHWTAGSPFFPGDSINVARHIDMFTVGVNYKFWSALSPWFR